MTDAQTIALYDEQARAYADQFEGQKPNPSLLAFIDDMPPGGHILDLGCGPGRAAAAMRQAGLHVDPVDASIAMVELAKTQYNLPARQATFDDITAIDAYDGIWANFSLTHAARDALPGHFVALAKALKPSGQLHLGMKTGAGDHRDSLGRLYTLVTQTELAQMLSSAGFTITAHRSGTTKGLAGDTDPFIVLRAQNHD